MRAKGRAAHSKLLRLTLCPTALHVSFTWFLPECSASLLLEDDFSRLSCSNAIACCMRAVYQEEYALMLLALSRAYVQLRP